MKSSLSRFKRVGLACVALGAIAVSQHALAAGTAANTDILNRATVNFQVGGVAQNPVESSPSGNSNSGVGNGADTTFKVDNKLDLTVTEVGAAATTVSAGAVNQVTTFKLTNTGNLQQGYQLAPTQAGGTLFTHPDTFDVTNVRRFVSAAACSGVSPTPTYNSATDTAVLVNTLAADGCVYVFIVADVPVTVTNGGASNVRLTATATAAGTSAATPLLETTTADTVGVDVVFADVGVNLNRTEFAEDQYWVQTAALSVQKTSSVISDPFNGVAGPGVFPKSIPGAVMEYGIKLTNTGAVSATVVTITDQVPANTTFTNNVYSSGTRNVSILVGATTTFCQAEAGGTDSNADGCFLTAGGVLTVGSPALGAIATGAGNAVTVSFRVTIN
jgi:uncharacterized repeat protein (TIGR01451 family)